MVLKLSSPEYQPDFMEIINQFFPVNEEHNEVIDIDYHIENENIFAHIKIESDDIKEYDYAEKQNEFQSQKTILKHIYKIHYGKQSRTK